MIRSSQPQNGRALCAQIDSLKNKIDSFREGRDGYVQGRYTPPSDVVNLLKLSDQDFYTLHKGFVDVFNHPEYKTLSFEKRLDALWAYMVMERYVRDFVQMPSMQAGRAKIQILNGAYNHIRVVLNDFVSDVNYEYKKERLDFRLPKHFYQKLLQVHSNQFDFNHDQAIESKSQNSYFRAGVLKLAKSKVTKDRHGQPISDAERTVNQTVIGVLDTYPTKFRVLNQAHYIEPNTGHELDLPFDNSFAIETDGPHHYQDQAYEAVHHFKALALREAGVTRVSVDARRKTEQLQAIATQYGRLLSLDIVHIYQDAYKGLVSAQKNIQNLLIDATYTARSSKLSHSDKNDLESMMAQLNDQEKKCRFLFRQRTLEKLFGDELTNRNSPASKAMATYFQIDQPSYMREIERRQASLAQRNETRAKYNKLKSYIETQYPDSNLSFDLERIQTLILNMHRSNPLYQQRVISGTTLEARREITELKEEIERRFSKVIKAKYFDQIESYWRILDRDEDDRLAIAEAEEKLFAANKELESTIASYLEPSLTIMLKSTLECENMLKRCEKTHRVIEDNLKKRKEKEKDTYKTKKRTDDHNAFGKRERPSEEHNSHKAPEDTKKNCRQEAILNQFGLNRYPSQNRQYVERPDTKDSYKYRYK